MEAPNDSSKRDLKALIWPYINEGSHSTKEEVIYSYSGHNIMQEENTNFPDQNHYSGKTTQIRDSALIRKAGSTSKTLKIKKSLI